MRTLALIVAFIAVGFLGVMGYFYVRDGSLKEAGAEVDKGLSSLDRTTKPLQRSLDDVGDATKETIDRATDGDKRT